MPRSREVIELPGGCRLTLWHEGWETCLTRWEAIPETNRALPCLGEQIAQGCARMLDIRVLEFTCSGETLAVIPTYIAKRRLYGVRLSVLGLVGEDIHDYLPLLVMDAAPRNVLIVGLRRAARVLKVDAIHLDHLGAPPPIGLSPFTQAGSNRCFDIAETPRGWNDLLRKESLKRHANRLKRDVDYRSTHRAGPIPTRVLDEIARLHTERWLFDNVASPFTHPHRKAQYEALGERTFLTVLYAGEEIVAAHVGLIFDRTLYWHTPVINIKYLPYSPLEVLLLETIRACSENGWKILDYGLGDETYKQRFSNSERPVWNIFIPISPLGHLSDLLRRNKPLFGQLKRWRTCLVDRMRLRRRNDESICSPPPARHASPPESRQLDIGDFGAFVDCMRATGHPPLRAHYERLRLGWRFHAIMENGTMRYCWWNAPA